MAKAILNNQIEQLEEVKVKAKELEAGAETFENKIAALTLLMNAANGVHKTANLILSMNLQTTEAEKKGTRTRMLKANLIGDNEAISTMNRSATNIICPKHGNNIINRETCLDYSGDEDHIGTCQKCEHFETTRQHFRP